MATYEEPGNAPTAAEIARAGGGAAANGPPPARGSWSTPFRESGWTPPRPTLPERLARAIRAHWILFALILLLVPAAAIVATLLQERDYAASAAVLLDTRADGERPGGERAFETQLALLELPAVAERAALGAGGRSPEDVRDAIEIEADEGDLVTIEARADGPAVAQALADSYADAYVSLAPSFDAGEPQVVQAAQRPEEQAPTNLARNAALGVAAGILLALMAAALIEGFDRRLKSAEELEKIYELPMLARIPRSRSLKRRAQQRSQDEALTRASGFSEEAEAFRALRANLRYFNVDRPVNSVLVVSPVSGDGKSTIARYLGVTMATMGDRVVVVDADLRKPDPLGTQGELRAEGLSLVLAGFPLDEALIEMPVAFDPISNQSRSLMRLPSGPLPPNPSELLESARMRWVIRQLEQRFDTVIIDSPALVTVSDALALVPAVSGVLIVSGLGQTSRNSALGLRKQLALLGGRPLGVVGNFWTSVRDDYYYGYNMKGGRR